MIRLRVDKVYKGVLVKDTGSIFTPGHEGECGIMPRKGETWLIFATTRNGNFETDLCTRTKSLYPKARDYNKEILEDDMKFLEQAGKQP